MSGKLNEKAAKIEAVINSLRGTCGSLSSAAEVYGIDDMDDDLCRDLDDEIFNCHICGWWCEISEEASEDAGLDEWTCRDCASQVEGFEE